MQRADEVVRGVGHQDAEDHVELKRAHQPPAPLGRRKLGNVHRPQHRRCADAQPADEAEDHQRRPVPRQRAADGGDHVKHGGDAQRLAPAELLPAHARAQRAHHGADQRDGHRPALALRAQVVEPDQRVDGAGDDHGVEAKEQAAQRAGQRRLHQVEVGSHRLASRFTFHLCSFSARSPLLRNAAHAPSGIQLVSRSAEMGLSCHTVRLSIAAVLPFHFMRRFCALLPW